MNTPATTNATKTVTNIVFVNTKSEIVSFHQFSTPLPGNDVNPLDYYNEPFKKAIVQFADGSAYTFSNTQKLQHANAA